MHFTLVVLFVNLAAAAPATLESRQCVAGAYDSLCPASAPAGASCRYDDDLNHSITSTSSHVPEAGWIFLPFLDWKCEGPGRVYNACRPM